MQETIIEKLMKHNNDYSSFEPFLDETPIKSSIIIPVYNKAELFKKTLENIGNHPEILGNPHFFELIVVDDCSERDIEGIALNFKPRFKFKYIRNPKNRGASYARNRGVKESSNKLLFLLDSDVLLPYDYFRNSWRIHNTSQNACVVGLAEEIPEANLKLRDIKYSDKPDITKDFRFFKDTSKYDSEEVNRDEYHLIDETNWFKEFGHQRKIGFWTLPYMVISHNMSVRRNHFDSVQGFDERLVGWGADDILLGAKLIANGCYIIPLRSTGAFVISHSPRLGNENEKRDQMLANKERYEKIIQESLQG